MPINEYNTLGNSNLSYFCPLCNNDNFLFKSLSDEEFVAHTKTATYQVLTNKTQYCTLETFFKNYKNLKDFIILHVSARSLIKNFSKLKQIIFSTKVCPDVISVSKTKLKDSITFPYNLPNYTFIQANLSTNAGGVGMFIKSKHSFNRVHSYDLNTNSCENIWIEILLKNRKKL